MAHHSDVGGITPGSVAVHATEIYQEGLRMPLLKLFDAGEENTTLFTVIEKNTRQPVQVLGDLRAQVAACRAGERGLDRDPPALRRRDSCTPTSDELQSLGERLMRAEIAALPDGEYSFVDWIDGVGEEPGAARASRSACAIAGEEISIDFTGTAPQVDGEHQLPGRARLRGLLLRDQGDRGARDPELRGLHAPDPDPRAGGDDRQPGAARRLRRARRRSATGSTTRSWVRSRRCRRTG